MYYNDIDMNNNKNSKGKLFIVSAPSGCGKTTINKKLAAMNLFEISVSCTTREPRTGEVDGVDYFFISNKEFVKMKNNGNFLEYAEVYGNYYGTPKGIIQNKLNKGTNVLLELDVQGAMDVKKKMKNTVLIFIKPPSIKDLSDRLSKRALDTPGVIQKRLSQAENEMSYSAHYDHVVTNSDLDKTIKKMKGIILNQGNLKNPELSL